MVKIIPIVPKRRKEQRKLTALGTFKLNDELWLAVRKMSRIQALEYTFIFHDPNFEALPLFQ